MIFYGSSLSLTHFFLYNLAMVAVPARVLVKKQRPIWPEQFISKENTVKTETTYESYEWQRAK